MQEPTIQEAKSEPPWPIKQSAMGVGPHASPFAMPFSWEIAEGPLLCKVKMPNMELYDGTTNPGGHY